MKISAASQTKGIGDSTNLVGQTDCTYHKHAKGLNDLTTYYSYVA